MIYAAVRNPESSRSGAAATLLTYGDPPLSLQALVDAGAQTQQDVKDVGYGRLIATVRDAVGSTIGLMQNPS